MPLSSNETNASNKILEHKLLFQYSSLVRKALLAAVVIIYLSIVAGGMVRVFSANSACPESLTCLYVGTASSDPGSFKISINFWHRLLSLLGGGPIIMLLVGSFRPAANPPGLRKLLLAAGFIFILQMGFGGVFLIELFHPIQPLFSAIHFVLALGLLSILLWALILHYLPQGSPTRLAYKTIFARLSIVAASFYFLLVLSGIFVARLNADQFCAGWPLCTPENVAGWFSLIHRFLVLGEAGLVTWLMINAWQRYRSHSGVLTAATATFVLFFAQALLGSRLGEAQPLYYFILHQATAAAVWITLLLHVFFVGLSALEPYQEDEAVLEFRARTRMAQDLMMLTKPIVVGLLLVTTYAGMVIGGQELPPLSLTFWTMVGGFMAAGGSGAINQFIDRQDDQRMQRTQKRPIPAGRLLPGEGLAFGVGLLLGSFYIMVAFVNIVAAMLCLAGMIYYVVIYSLLLKKTTVQNIVIGGGAGAIPPLVGWAAATGSLNIPSLFLFAVIFMWTPPHFWALALVRRNDYARAGVPMLPVVRGEEETRKQILVFSLELVLLTLLLPLVGLGGGIYWVGAMVLGLWLLHAAWRVWRLGGNKLAWKMYRYSSMYLAFLFVLLAADALL